MKVQSTTSGTWLFWCPGCETPHNLDSRWTFNGDIDRPTFSPSLLVGIRLESRLTRCHSFVREGRIQFLQDSDRALSGQTVELPDWPFDDFDVELDES